MKTIVLFSILLISISSLWAQENDTININHKQALNVFFTCGYCDMSYFRENFKTINYVRDRKVADVHIISTTMSTGSGGTEYQFLFIGQGRFAHLNDTLVFQTDVNQTWDEERVLQLDMIKKGLVPFIMKTDMANRIKVSYVEPEEENIEEDRWNNWIFTIGAHTWTNGQQSYNSLNAWGSINASRITEQIKHESGFSLSYDEDEYRLYDDNDSLIYHTLNIQRSFSVRHSTIWSLGNHFGAGISFVTRQSVYSNLDLSVSLKPAFEYNLFSYDVATRKQLRFGYELGLFYLDYTDTTVFDKTRETVLRQDFDINFKYITAWGSVRSGLYWSNYMHDFSLYSIGGSLSSNIRIAKGLSFNISGHISLPRNQIMLVKTETTPEDLLLRQRELKSSYSYYTSMGISYTFGSIYNNVVNPRLD